ncbi:sugar ABC transporter permease [Pseudoclavibacter sp. RFBJ3]|uniref:carbohydrate ABC transporter permease n=1 Tax=unclassified Pseudoclavibacter TaxID=2615177 RepID=UPI000CE85C7F|nr:MULTISPECIES: sugar ABC transporter permease [unclassified Pseudoclavibacter]MBF4550067.1 sugar ABC transporter permease [Pseudoclavibacter sp. VKM Ac-2888]PPF38492.1 sugar ABC transporter permease [Pseudoclavibacter sp. AY1H1]PPF74873.1 sugar ABC transporter permease [Pseudoclavibacter sp. Z016]PPF83889.1 sugar ABC transporter permease [Pseudoclavibacter sp. RFBJ5]PPF92169.1 sugar ABC transporter permease [Pseudoclavibacter sp. RFBJ3]
MTSERTVARRKVIGGKSRKPFSLRSAPYLFLLPNMAIFGLFTIWPAINGFNISMYSSSNGRTFAWEGLGNYQTILSDTEFWGIVWQTVVYAVAFVLLSVVLGTLLAVLVEQQRRGRSFFRAVFFIPVLISPVVAGLVWNWMLERQGGIVNAFLGLFGVAPVPWLVEGPLAMLSVIVVGTWMQVGFYMLILLAGLQSIDPSLYEAAQLDGASRWKQFTNVTLPLLQPSILVVVVLATIHGFQAFDFIYTLTGGGPVGATTLIVQYIYENGFVSPIRYGLASAGSVLLFIVIFTITIVNYLIGRKRDAV